MRPTTQSPRRATSAFAWRTSGTVVMAFYGDGATLGEVRVTHPLAVVEAVEDSLVGEGSRA